MGIDAQGVHEVLVEAHLPIDVPPVCPAGVHQGVELPVGDVLPLPAQQLQRLDAGIGVVPGETLEPHPLAPQAGCQLRFAVPRQTGFDQPQRPG